MSVIYIIENVGGLFRGLHCLDHMMWQVMGINTYTVNLKNLRTFKLLLLGSMGDQQNHLYLSCQMG